MNSASFAHNKQKSNNRTQLKKCVAQEIHYLQKCIFYENRWQAYSFLLFVNSTEEPYGTTSGGTMVRNERKMSQMHSIMRERREANLAIENMLSSVQNEGNCTYIYLLRL